MISFSRKWLAKGFFHTSTSAEARGGTPAALIALAKPCISAGVRGAAKTLLCKGQAARQSSPSPSSQSPSRHSCGEARCHWPSPSMPRQAQRRGLCEWHVRSERHDQRHRCNLHARHLAWNNSNGLRPGEIWSTGSNYRRRGHLLKLCGGNVLVCFGRVRVRRCGRRRNNRGVQSRDVWSGGADERRQRVVHSRGRVRGLRAR